MTLFYVLLSIILAIVIFVAILNLFVIYRLADLERRVENIEWQQQWKKPPELPEPPKQQYDFVANAVERQSQPQSFITEAIRRARLKQFGFFDEGDI